MAAVTVDSCAYCGSPFLRACTAPGWYACRSCGRLAVLKAREVLADVLPGAEAFVTLPADQPATGPQIEGLVRVQRWTPRGLRCEHMAIRTPEPDPDPVTAGV